VSFANSIAAIIVSKSKPSARFATTSLKHSALTNIIKGIPLAKGYLNDPQQ